jgi:hypothetical protein
VGDLFPSAFEFYIGGHMGRSYGLELFPDALYYIRRPGGSVPDEEATLRPDPERWKRFWADMDKIGVWGWLPSYERMDILDGTGWSLELALGDRRIVSGGSNAYPDGFRDLLAAVNRLVALLIR